MAANSYTPGTWTGVVRAGTAVFLAPGAPPALIDSLWELLAGQPEVHEVLHAVTSASSGSLAEIPWFGIVDGRDSLRVFLRGDIELTAQLSAGPVELNGRDVTTWTERRLTEPEWYRVSVPGDDAGAALPLGEGVVLLQGLTVGLVAAALPPVPPMPPMPGTSDAEPALPAESPTAEVPAAQAPVTEAPVTEVPVTEAPATQAPVTEAPAANVAAEPGQAAPQVPAEVPEPDRDVPAEHGASAETVMGLPDDDLEYTATGTGIRDDEDVPDVPGSAPAGQDPEPVPVNELTSSYDHLWDKTVMRRIEDAAVRDEPRDEPHAGPGDGNAQNPGGPEESAAGNGDPGGTAAQESLQVPAQPLIPARPAVPAQPPIPVQQGVLIDSVPWHTGGDNAARPPAPPSFVPPAAGEVPDWRSPSAVPPVPEGDHDGETVMKSDVTGLGPAARTPVPAVGTDANTGPMVLARVCVQGHANPPTHSQCTGCGMALPSDAVQVRRPRLGRVRVSTGELIDLDQSLVIGRQPSVSRVQGGGMPKLVQVPSPSGDISRSHVEVRLEGWHVMLCDLKATNGTVLVREGQPPRRLAQNEMAILLDGDIAELGDDVSLRFEEIL